MTLSALVVLGMVATGGCSYTTQKSPQLGLFGLQLEKLCRTDYEVLETVEGTGSVTTVFGFKTGDNQFGFVGNEGLPPAEGLGGIFNTVGALFKGLREFVFGPDRTAVPAAVYDAMTKIPEADSFLPMSRTMSTTGLPGFLGFFYSKQEASVRGKAIKIDNGDGKDCPVPRA